jgi:hypothetical protein
MGEHRLKADGRRLFSTKLKRAAIQGILTGERKIVSGGLLVDLDRRSVSAQIQRSSENNAPRNA